ncbi:isoflavone reductase [Lasiosphaeria ovina]|uniref:Isoflavone reductase n=1 Tax=Lasiosphaeria ovina TaxID=92902 RepID=A0AAE0KN78_9PEZI|nr:isoflavone reductase [Lasiosphaeria ovina]
MGYSVDWDCRAAAIWQHDIKHRDLVIGSTNIKMMGYPAQLGFPSLIAADIEVRRADLESVPSLTTAFAGQDAVLVTVGYAGIAKQNTLRFIPLEFGHQTDRLTGTLAALLAGKTKTREYLIEQTKAHPLKDKTAHILDSGNELVSKSTLEFVGQAVAAVLTHEEQTANRYIDAVVEFTVSQNGIVRLLEETGAKFTITRGSTEELQKRGEEKILKGDYHTWFGDFLLAWNFKDGANVAVKDEDLSNEELGLKGKTVQERVREYVQSRSA